MLQGTRKQCSLSRRWPVSWMQRRTVFLLPHGRRPSPIFATSSREPSRRASLTPWTCLNPPSMRPRGTQAPNRPLWTRCSTTAHIALPIIQNGAGRSLLGGEDEKGFLMYDDAVWCAVRVNRALWCGGLSVFSLSWSCNSDLFLLLTLRRQTAKITLYDWEIFVAAFSQMKHIWRQ